MMKTILLTCILTLATAASALIIVEHSPWRSDRESRLVKRLEAIENRLKEAPSETQPAAKKLPKGLKERIDGVEAQVWDSERAIRKDLKMIFERLVQRLDDIAAKAGPKKPGSTSDPAAKKALFAKLETMGIRVDEKQGMIVLNGEFGQPTRSLEFTAVAPGGMAHESMMVIDVIPSALKVALEALGLKEVPDADPDTGEYPPNADGVYIYVSWDGLKKPKRLEDLLLNTETRESLDRCKWLFTASLTYTNKRTWERVFQADVARNLISLSWAYAPACILACPDKATINENIWQPLDAACPPPGTKLKILLTTKPRPQWDKI